MQDKSINNSLLALRRQIILDNLDGLDHVEALLRLRGVRLRQVHKPCPDKARQGAMSRLVVQCLCDGPKSVDDVAEYVAKQRAELPPKDARVRARHALNNLSRGGLVVFDGRVWSGVLDTSRIM